MGAALMSAPATPRPSAEDRIRAATWFADHGFGVFSVWSTDPDGTCRCPLRGACENAGKHPVPVTGFKAATTDAAKIRTMLSAASEPNWGMLPPEGVFALDVDGEGIARLGEIETKHGPLPDTLRTNTTHGQHVFLRWPTDLPRPIGQLFGYVTRWGSGRDAGYVIGPRSVHASGGVYAPAPGTLDIAEIPEAWARAAVAAPEADTIKVTGSFELPDRFPPGAARYPEIVRYTAHLYDTSRLSTAEMWPLVRDVLGPRFADPLTEDQLRDRFERATSKISERLGQRRNAPEERRTLPPGIDAADLLAKVIAPLRWIVPDLIPEGTTILAAPPKVGKSCLVYQVAVEAAIGGDLLGRRVTPGAVLYLALEDGERRGQDRLRSVLAGRTMPEGRLEIRWNANRIGAGLEDDIGQWLDDHGDAVMVALDTLGKVRPRSTGKQGAYEIDVQDLARLQDLFRNRPVALLIVHHARKEASDDFLASVSGTYGLTGSADTIVAIRRKRLEAFGTISTTGRDIADAEVSVRFDGHTWTAAPGSLSEASFEQTEVYEVIEAHGPMFAKAIGDRTGRSRDAVQHLVEKLVDRGSVVRVQNGYAVATVSIETGNPSNTLAHSAHSTPPAHSNPTAHSTHSDSERSERGEISRARAVSDSGTWIHACRDYKAHQTSHRQMTDGWACPVCYPEDVR